MEKKIINLLQAIKKEHICSIEFKKQEYQNTKKPYLLATLKKQLGNSGGARIEIDFTEEEIHDIRFLYGSYNSHSTIKKDMNILFDLIINSLK